MALSLLSTERPENVMQSLNITQFLLLWESFIFFLRQLALLDMWCLTCDLGTHDSNFCHVVPDPKSVAMET